VRMKFILWGGECLGVFFGWGGLWGGGFVGGGL